MNCLILEDQVLLADLLRHELLGIRGLKVVATAHDVAEGKRLCRLHQPDLLLLDLFMPDGQGVEVAEELLGSNRDARIIVLSAQVERLVCSRHLHEAIIAVVDKTEAVDTLHDLLRRELRRRREDALGPDCLDRLTEREREVFTLIGQGLSSEEIAARLNISTLTARTHRRNITAKLGVRGGELVLLASAYSLKQA
jgi:DNA-binding NarL/FixJ family response regulator